MKVVLDRMGFGPVFLQRIELLYKCPLAAIKFSGEASNIFLVSRGTVRVVSCLRRLFALMMQLMGLALYTSTEVCGIQVSSLEEKTTIYTDDMVLFLQDSDI